MPKTVKLSDEEASRLSVMLGYAVGAASREGHPDLRNAFMLLSSKIVKQLEEQATKQVNEETNERAK